MAERFAKERMRQRRGARGFQLDDAAGEEEQLTHEGQALSSIHFPTQPRSDDASNDREAGRIDADDVHALHFGGGTDPYSLRAAMSGGEAAGGVRSKKEVMDEVILKSKKYKMERQQETQAQADLISALDTDFSAIRAMLTYRSDKREEKATAEAAGKAEAEAEAEEDGEDDFMRQTHKLAEEARVKAADRVKTAEEAAAEEKQRMERMERARLRRMRGEEDEGEEEAGQAADGVGSRRRRRREQEKKERREEQVAEVERKKRVKTATEDDLVENYIVDKAVRKRQREAEMAAELDDEEDESALDGEAASDEEDEEEEGEEVEGEDEDEEEEESGDEDENELEAPDTGAAKAGASNGRAMHVEQASKASSKPGKTAKQASASRAGPSAAEDTVPFIFAAPTSHRHLQSLLAPYAPSLHPLIYRRMQQYHFLALTADNRGAMEVFTAVLLTHFHALVKQHTAAVSSAAAPPPLSSLLAHLDAITSVLADVVQIIPSHVAAAARQLLLTFSTTPPPAHNAALLAAKLLFNLFPSSDARHNVVTPLYLWLASSLTYAPAIASAAGLVRALLCCQLVLAGVAESRRFVPEVLSELWAVLVRGWGVDEAALGVMPVYLKHVGVEQNVWQRMGDVSAESGGDGWKVDLQAMFAGDEAAVLSSPSLLCSLFALTLRLVTQASALYSQLPSHPELFAPFHSVLQHTSRTHSASLPASLVHLLDQTCRSLSAALSAPRPSFGLPSAPASIRQHTPAYIDGYQPGRDYDPIKERAEARELTRKVRREKRGAEKELRKDAEYVRAEEGRDREAREEVARAKRRHEFRNMELQAADTNLLHKSSKKKGKKAK